MLSIQLSRDPLGSFKFGSLLSKKSPAKCKVDLTFRIDVLYYKCKANFTRKKGGHHEK